ncbi:MAG: hypothetical protein AB7I42_22800 [Bradyrhizobium sp.]|uniref:hypothetical protein n=1 Tax=Bradyrhizobium sp. TaxID=376 RepID=UPI003D14CC6F
MADKYDKAMAYLLAAETDEDFTERVWDAWRAPYDTDGGALFQHAGTGPDCGCLTSVRRGSFDAETPELTAAIRADERIPKYCADITRDNLPVFAEWQRRIDRELGRS